MKRIAAAAFCTFALLAVGCGDDDESTTGSAGTASQQAPPPDEANQADTVKKAEGAQTAEQASAKGTEIVVAGSDYGEILYDSSEQAIYLFDKESGSTSECYGSCAEAWPPVLTEGRPQAGSGVDPGLLGTTKRDDGTTQVTYGGHPLYFYAHEPPGVVLCQNVEEFGGLWLVVDAAGDAVT